MQLDAARTNTTYNSNAFFGRGFQTRDANGNVVYATRNVSFPMEANRAQKDKVREHYTRKAAREFRMRGNTPPVKFYAKDMQREDQFVSSLHPVTHAQPAPFAEQNRDVDILGTPKDRRRAALRNATGLPNELVQTVLPRKRNSERAQQQAAPGGPEYHSEVTKRIRKMLDDYSGYNARTIPN